MFPIENIAIVRIYPIECAQMHLNVNVRMRTEIIKETTTKTRITNWVQITNSYQIYGYDFEYQTNDMQIILKRIRMNTYTWIQCTKCTEE